MKISKLVKRIFLILLLTVVAIGIISPRGLVLVCRYWSMLIVDLRYQNSDPWAAMADLLAVPDAKKPAFHALVKSKFSNLDADYHPDYFGGCLTTDHDPTKARQFVSQLKTEAAKL